MSFTRDPPPHPKAASDPSNSTLLETFLATEPGALARVEQTLLGLAALERVDIVLGSGAGVPVPEHLRERMVDLFPDLHGTGKLRFPGLSEAQVVWLVRPPELDCERGVKGWLW